MIELVPPTADDSVASPAPRCVETLRRYLVVLAFAFWQGGFTFYAGVVIWVGNRVMGSEREVGFITQQVTHYLNFIGLGALLILLWDVLVARRDKSSRLWRSLALAWAVMAVMQAALFVLHPYLDELLVGPTKKVLQPAHFYRLHALYMDLAAVQWAAGLAYAALMLAAWRSRDLSSKNTAGN